MIVQYRCRMAAESCHISGILKTHPHLPMSISHIPVRDMPREMRSYTNEKPIHFCRNNPILIMTAYFQSSSRLTFVWRKHWIFVIILSLFLVIDLLLWSANSFEFVEGAWIATLISFIIFFIGFYWHYDEKKI